MMKWPFIYRSFVAFSVLLLILTSAGCANLPISATSVPTSIPVASPTSASIEATASPEPVEPVNTDENVLFQDDFTNPATGWLEEKFDNYFVGYHEPEYYHIEITSPNYKIPIFAPNKQTFNDATIETKAFTVAAKTATTGDFAYGTAFRRSGDQYYAFTISPRTKKWFVLKSSPNALVVLAEGTDESIHDLDAADILRVDAQGSDFSFYINDQLVGQVTDAEYASGEFGFFVQTFDSPNVHIHFDDVAILEAPESSEAANDLLYHDDFTNPATAWAEEKFDNYFVGYHEPEYYHIEITSPNYKTAIFEPGKQNFKDATIEVKAFTVGNKTATTGDFAYGTAFRRSGDQYYAFAISPRTKKWYVLKSSSTALTILAEGTDESIHDLDAADALRVDAQGSDFSFHINDHLVEQLSDPDYVGGEVGFFVQTFDSPNVHIHFDDVAIRNFEAPQPSEAAEEMLYQDDFTNPATAWPEKKFDNYFIGYHEPEYYHIEITSPNYKTPVFAPEKQSFSNVSIGLTAFTVGAKTATTGDFAYGTAFRRSGDQYYAFTISPRTKKWYVLKSSSTALTILAEGTDKSIHDLDAADILRVDAQGPDFAFHINDRLVGQVTDPDYASGEVGFFVQTFDSPNVHIHFDDLTIQTFEALPACTVRALALNLRSGPGTKFSSSTFLTQGDAIQPLARTADGQWIKIRLEGSEEQGWVFNSTQFLSCTSDTSLLPVDNP
jgi:hypothetical protein